MVIYPELVGRVFSLLPSDDLLNCRLVCKLFKDEVDHHLATVTQVIINESEIDSQTYVRRVLYNKQICRSLACREKAFDDLFSFLHKFCRNLQVLSATKNGVSLEHLTKVAKNLIYFEVNYVTDVEEKTVGELETIFPVLKVVNIFDRLVHPRAFCLNSWPTHQNAQHRWVQSRDICCDHPPHESMMENSIPPGTTWYIARSRFNSAIARQLKEPSVAQSLRVLELRSKDISFDFHLPNLTAVDLYLDECSDVTLVIESLRRSSDLQIMQLWFNDSLLNCNEISGLIGSLKKLKSIALLCGWDDDFSCITLSLPPEVEHVKLDGFIALPSLESQSVKYIFLSSPISPVNLPNLIQCRIYFGDVSRPDEVLDSLRNSPNLTRLDLTFNNEAPTVVQSLHSCLAQLVKLESFEMFTSETKVDLTDLYLSKYSSLRYLNWFDEGGKNKPTVHFDEKYQWKIHSVKGFIVKPPMRHPVKIFLSPLIRFNFKFPL